MGDLRLNTEDSSNLTEASTELAEEIFVVACCRQKIVFDNPSHDALANEAYLFVM